MKKFIYILFTIVVSVFVIILMPKRKINDDNSTVTTETLLSVESEPETLLQVEEVEKETEAIPLVQEEPEPEYITETFKLTAYCPCMQCCGKTDGITASGTKATEGRTIAVDPNIIPFGTEVIINGHTYIAEDKGGAIKDNRIDVYFDSHQDALEFGVQYADVLIKIGE